jgi:hypothetical protein
VLEAAQPNKPGQPLQIYTYTKDLYHADFKIRQLRINWIALCLSSVKLVEVGLLWKEHAIMLAGITLFTWLVFFLFGVILQIYNFAKRQSVADSVDIIASDKLPAASSAGGDRRVVLGIPVNPRRNLLWESIWALSGVVFTITIVLTYITLGRSQRTETFYIWMLCQLIWIVLRSVVVHSIEDQEHPYRADLEGKRWAELGTQEKVRVRALMHAVAKFQYHIHPRGPMFYNEDAEPTGIENLSFEYPLPTTSDTSMPIDVDSVIGDTVLASVSWMFGSTKGGFDFYDTCIVILNLKERKIAVPSARVLSGI